jgi:hypothetical protein
LEQLVPELGRLEAEAGREELGLERLVPLIRRLEAEGRLELCLVQEQERLAY